MLKSCRRGAHHSGFCCWGSALLPEELENIARATGPKANNITIGTGGLQGEQQLYSEQQQQLQRPPPPPQQQQFGYGQSLPLLLPRPPPPQQFPNALHPLHPLPPSPSHPPSECPSEIPIAFATIDSSNEISG